MQIRLLGTAAGGGVPQWNCNCAVCREARTGSGRVRSRTQSCVAISADGERWFLLNASPDLRIQIEGFPALQPRPSVLRGSPIEGVLLTNADLDHSLGLLLLREGRRLPVHATAAVRRALTEGLTVAPVLDSFCGVEWREPPTQLVPLPGRDAATTGLLYQAIPLAGKPPRYMEGRAVPTPGDSIGYRFVDEKTGGRLVFLPDVAALDDACHGQLSAGDAVLFDGTFWSEDEMQTSGVGQVPAAKMGHLPISGPRGSLKLLAGLRAPNRIFVHINNTNPILLEDSPERAVVQAAGWVVGWDGMQIEI